MGEQMENTLTVYNPTSTEHDGDRKEDIQENSKDVDSTHITFPETGETSTVRSSAKEECMKSVGYGIALTSWMMLGTMVFMGIEGYYQRSLAYQRHDLYLQYLNRAEKILCEKAGAGPRCFAAMPAIHQRFQRVNANLTKASSTKCSLAGLKLKGWSNKTHTDSIMYALSVVSTVGWGVFAPTNSTLRIITIFYAIIGLPLFGGMIAFTRDGVKALERQILNVKWIQEMVGSRVLLVMIAGLFLSFCMIGYGVLCWVLEKDEEGTIYEELHRQLKFDMTSDKQTWSFFTGIYYAFITMSCIGFGDEYIYDAHALLTYLKPLVQFLSIVIVIALLTRAFEGVEKKMHKVVDKSVSKLTTRT